MRGIPFDEILRSLPPRGEVQVTLSEIPLDELLVTLHETRFTGRLWLSNAEEEDELRFRRGQVIRVNPEPRVHMRVLRETLLDLKLVEEAVLEAQIMADARLSAADVLDCFVFRRLIDFDAVKTVNYDIARRRLLELFTISGAQVLVENGFEDPEDAEAILLNPLPAIAYGLVACTSLARRNAMLAFASSHYAKLDVSYDTSRNRLGLPKAFMSAVNRLSTRGIFFGPQPCLPGLTPEDTAGLLLLFRRMGLLTLSTEPPEQGQSLVSLESMDEVTDRLDRDFI